MEGTTRGNGDRHERANDSSTRRKTVSGPIPQFQHEHETEDPTSDPEDMRYPWSSTSTPFSPTSAQPASPELPRSISHRRAPSNNLLSRFPFLRLGNEDGRPTSPNKDSPASLVKEPRSPTKSLFSRKSNEDDHARPSAPTYPTKGENVMAAVIQAGKTRKRKGSLRKTALLGTRRAAPEGRERKSSLSMLQRPNLSKQAQASEKQQESDDLPVDVAAELVFDHVAVISPTPETYTPALSEQSIIERPVTASSSDSSWSGPSAAATTRLSLVTSQKAQMQRVINQQTVSDLGSPLDVKSPTSQASYTASTTDDDDVLTFERPAKQFPPANTSSVTSSLNDPATSYFPPASDSSLSARPRRAAKRSSPLSHSVQMPSYSEPEPHDYTETEYWGWVILFVTWLTFTVGMGSCLEIWSWAWNVGFKPYAPPELQDDQTLPIVGYYPALIVLTGVVAWVWITVAWVGMKYFRHAKIEV